MRLIKPSYEIIDIRPRGIAIPDDMEIGPKKIQEELLYTVYRQIEAAGKTYYKSEDKPTKTSAEEFVNEMIKSKDYGILEFGTVYLECPVSYYNVAHTEELQEDNPLSKYNYDDHSRCFVHIDINSNVYCYVTTNYRVLVENNWLSDLKYICEPTEFHEKRVCVKFICDIGVSSELVKHRTFSFAQESADYSNSKFDNQLTFIIPSFLSKVELIKYFGDIENLEYDKDIHKFQTSEWPDAGNFLQSIAWSEANYLTLIHNKLTPQEARCVLPNCLKTEINMCGFTSDWERLFKSEFDIHSYLQTQVLIERLHEEFKKKFKIK